MEYRDFSTMPLVLSVEDIADTLAIGRNKAYTLVNTGVIKALKIGQHYRIPRDNFIEFVKAGTEIA
jgi:excisionase family DNA binding protein